MKTSIPASFLDLNLRPLEFRLLCHFYVWGKCVHAVPTLAEYCHADPKTVKNAIDRLIELGFVERTRRRRETSVYTINSRTVEKPFSTEDQISPSYDVQRRGEYRSDPHPKTVFLNQEPPKTEVQEKVKYDPRNDPKCDWSLFNGQVR